MNSYTGQRGTSRSIALPPRHVSWGYYWQGRQQHQAVQSRSGARIIINNSTGRVEVSGSSAAVDEALRLLMLQIDAFKATGGSYPHPLQVLYLLDRSFGDTGRAVIGFQAASDEVAVAADRPEQLYVMRPADVYGGSLEPVAGGVADLLSGLSLGSSSAAGARQDPWLLLHGQREVLLQAAATAAKQAISHRPAFDELKLRFNFGKNFFYKGPSTYTSWTVQQLQRKSIPADLKSVFSNAVTAAAQERLVFWLQQQGFKSTQEKHTASVHLVQRSSNAGYALSFIKSGRSLVLRKIKSSNSKLAFGTLLNDPARPDWRFKLLAQYNCNTASANHQLLADLASSATLTGSSSSSSSSVRMPGLSAADMVVDKERHKDKTIYQGTWPPSPSTASGNSSSTMIKVTASRMYDATHHRSGCEVAGTSPQLQALLQQLLQYGCLRRDQECEVQQHLANILAFAEAAARAMASSHDYDDYGAADDYDDGYGGGYDDEFY